VGSSYNFTFTTTNNAPANSAGNPNVPMGSENRHLDLARLLNGAFPTWDSSAAASIGGVDAAGFSPQNRVLALQLAVWEIANEDKSANGYNILGGDFKLNASSSVATLAQTFLANIGGTWNNADNTLYRALTLIGKQDYVIKIMSDSNTVVPIPAAAWLLGSGLLGLFGLSRRRQKTTEA
jgi:hypothetical protein